MCDRRRIVRRAAELSALFRSPATLVVALVAFVGLVTIDSAGSARSDRTYTDPRGDAGPGTDITDVTVRNDTAGNITVQIAIASPLPDNHYLALHFDADNNPATGLLLQGQGSDFYGYGSKSFGQGFYRWSGSQWELMSASGFQAGFAASQVVEFRLTRAVLGNPSRFTLAVFSGSGDVSGGAVVDTFRDRAGWFQYALAAGGSSGGTGLKITKVSRTPPVPYAGEWYAIKVSVSRVQRSGRFYGVVGCEARIGKAGAEWSGSVAPGTAKCSFFAPQSAAGKTIAGAVTVREGNVSARRAFKATIVRQPQRLIGSRLVETVPPQPRAGALFGYKLPVSIQKGIRDGRPVVSREISKVTCTARLGGKPIAARESRAVAGAVRCVWDIPSYAAGSKLTAVIRAETPQTASAAAATLVHSFARTVGR